MTVAYVAPAHKSGSSIGNPQKPLMNNPSICLGWKPHHSYGTAIVASQNKLTRG